MADRTNDESLDDLDSFEAELEGLLLQDHKLSSRSLDMRLREELPRAVHDRLKLSDSLGSGGAGAVIRVVDRTTNKTLAMKMLHVEGTSAAQRARIKREYRAGRRLSHPHVVRSDDFFEGEKVWAFTMELMEGSLRRRLTQGPLEWKTAVHVAQEVLAALDHVHSEHVVHRDVKPENILFGLSPDGTPGPAKLADFGIARFGELGSYSSLYGLAGTPAYMPPESFDERRFDPRGDLYALGLVLLEMLSGAHPIDPTSEDGWPQRHRELAPTRPPGIPDELWDLIVRLLQPRPEARPRTARDAFETLSELTPPRVELPPLKGGVYVASTALIGRDDEVRAAQSWLTERLHSKGPPVLWLSGPAGVGKSRLLQQLAADDGGIELLFGRGQRHIRRPFSSLSSVMSHLGRRPDVPDTTLTTLTTARRTEEETGTPLTEQSRAPKPPIELAHRAFIRSAVDELLAAAERSPLLIVVEDIHWSDDASLELLDELARALTTRRRPAAILATSRPLLAGSQPEKIHDRLVSDGLARELKLSPLPLSHTTELVSALLMDEKAGAELAVRLHEAGITTPLHVVQTLHLLLSRGALSKPGELAFAHLPQTVHNAVGERAANLSGVAKALLAMAAILGSEFTVPELSACLESEALGLLDYLDEAEQNGFVSQNASASETYRFVHEELRDALLTGLDEERAELHRRAARGLTEVYTDRESIAARIAYHLSACEDWPDAWEWGRLAGEVALEQYGYRASAKLFDRAFEAAEKAGIEADAQTWQLRGDALMFNDRNKDAAHAYEEALSRITTDESDREVVILGRLAELEYRSSRLTHAIEPFEALLPRLGARVATTDAEIAESIESLERELANSTLVAPIPPDEVPRSEVLCHTFRNLAEVAYYFRATRKDYYAAEATRLALRLGTTSAAAQAFGLFAFLAAQDGRFDLVDRAALHAATASDACDDVVATMFAKSMVASARVMGGEPSKGLAASSEAWELAQKVAEPLRLMTVASIQSLSLTAIGRTDESAAVAETMHELGVRHRYTRVTEMAYLCGAAAAVHGLRFDEVLELTSVADELEARGSRMMSLQLRSYRALARAFLDPEAGLTAALDVADEWADEGFGSMLCNPASNALIAGALAAPALEEVEIERLERCIEHAWEASHRNRAKTGLFLAGAGLFRRRLGSDEEGWLEAGLDWANRHGLMGDVALIEAACELAVDGSML